MQGIEIVMQLQDFELKARELTDAIQAIAPMTVDGRGLCDRALEKALREHFCQGYNVGFAAAGEAIVKELKGL